MWANAATWLVAGSDGNPMAESDFDAETKVRFDPKNYMQMAGLTNYYDDLCWSWAFVTWDEKRHARVIEVAQNDFNQYTSFLKDDAIVVPEDAEKFVEKLGELDKNGELDPKSAFDAPQGGGDFNSPAYKG